MASNPARRQYPVGNCGIVLTKKRPADLVLVNPHLVAWRERKQMNRDELK